jgi:hypothetical protein
VLEEAVGRPPRDDDLAPQGLQEGHADAAAGPVAGLIAPSQLWSRHHSLEAPLEAIEAWDPEQLRSEALASLDPARACLLEAVPA